MKNIFLAVLLFLSYQPTAYAYLDPGSGSMLLSALIGIVATVFFSIKGLIYKIKSLFFSLFGVKIEKNIHKLVFYSEGAHYWHTFKPILQALDKQGVEAVYLTSSDNDEGLKFSSKTIRARYIGEGNTAFTYLNMLEAHLCVMSTPGLDVLQIRRSSGVKHYAYISHSPIDMGKYKLYSFEGFDSIFLSGPHQAKSIRTLEKLRGTEQKQLIEAGCPYMDDLALRLEGQQEKVDETGAKKTILIAPTWGEHNFLKKLGAVPIRNLLENGYKVIIRPHPQSYVAEPEIINELKQALSSYENLRWDSSPDNFDSLFKSDILISALSGIVFDYAFVFEKPVITVDLSYNFIGQEANDLPYPVWELTVLDDIGTRVSPEQLNNASSIIEGLLKDESKKENLRSLRAKSLYNYKSSGEVIAKNLVKLMEDINA